MESEAKHSSDNRILYIFVPVFVVLLIIGSALLPSPRQPDAPLETYQYHIAIIGENTDDSFWNLLYRGVNKAAGEYGAIAEETGAGLSQRVTTEDAIKMAIYEDADGILLLPGSDEALEPLIDQAEDAGIPVISMERDLPDSRRSGFVGINAYFLGQQFGREILKRSGSDASTATILFPADRFDESSRQWFLQGLASAVPSEKITFRYETVESNGSSLNNSEDIIQKLLSEDNVPDILVTLDSMSTQSAFQLLTSRSMVSRVTLIGTGISSDILDEIENGGIKAVISTDPVQLGEESVRQLMTYQKYHMVSYYTEITPVLIDASNVQQYRKEFYDDSEK